MVEGANVRRPAVSLHHPQPAVGGGDRFDRGGPFGDDELRRSELVGGFPGGQRKAQHLPFRSAGGGPQEQPAATNRRIDAALLERPHLDPGAASLRADEDLPLAAVAALAPGPSPTCRQPTR